MTEILPSKIRKNKTLSKNKLYIVRGEVRVLPKVTIKAQDKVNILLINGIFKASSTKRSTLIFDQGSKLLAKNVTLQAANESFKPVKEANNGGLWFLGNFANASKDGLTVKVNRKNSLSHFKAQMITSKYLGRKDKTVSQKSGKLVGIGDDIDGISILGVGPNEWLINSIKSSHSADDGIDLTNSHIKISSLKVITPTEDGINLSSSRIAILKKLHVEVSKTSDLDRDIVDLETDDGASYLELHRGCEVKICGVFGDQVILSSTEMPKPNTRADNESPYFFEGKLKQSALIYSIDQD